MKRQIILAAAMSLSAAVSAQEADKAHISYMIGYDVGSRLSQLDIDMDMDQFVLAVRHAMAGEEATLSAEQLETARLALTAHGQKIQQEREEQQRVEMAAASEKNIKMGQEFLAENAKRDGVVVTDSGLQYEVIELGDGPKPAATDQVEVHYRGTLIDGTEFDSSYSRNSTATFGLNQVIKGWTEGLQLMPVGSKFKFYIPADLAYGGRNMGAIGPNSTLIFDVELIDIKD